MKHPIYNIGTLEYKGENIEFYYPAEFIWRCTHCGACCRDLPERKRNILLTKKDIVNIENVGKNSFYEREGNPPFIGIMKMEEGKCFFFKEGRCMIYDNRALLCRTYPFWIERHSDMFIIRPDPGCPGKGAGEELGGEFFKELLLMVLVHMDY